MKKKPISKLKQYNKSAENIFKRLASNPELIPHIEKHFGMPIDEIDKKNLVKSKQGLESLKKTAKRIRERPSIIKENTKYDRELPKKQKNEIKQRIKKELQRQRDAYLDKGNIASLNMVKNYQAKKGVNAMSHFAPISFIDDKKRLIEIERDIKEKNIQEIIGEMTEKELREYLNTYFKSVKSSRKVKKQINSIIKHFSENGDLSGSRDFSAYLQSIMFRGDIDSGTMKIEDEAGFEEMMYQRAMRLEKTLLSGEYKKINSRGTR